MNKNREGCEVLILDYYANKKIARSTNVYESNCQPMEIQLDILKFGKEVLFK